MYTVHVATGVFLCLFQIRIIISVFSTVICLVMITYFAMISFVPFVRTSQCQYYLKFQPLPYKAFPIYHDFKSYGNSLYVATVIF